MVNRIDIGGYPLAYVEAGAGVPAVLLIHGSMSDYRSWVNQMAPFAARYRTLAVSLRHCYPEQWDGSGDDFTIEQHATDVAAFIEHMKLGPTHVVGHSRGGAVAIQLALQRPDLIRTLVLGDPAALESLLPDTPEGRVMARESAIMFEQLARDLQTTDAESSARTFAEALNGPGAWERRTPEARQVMLDNIRTGPACAKRPVYTSAHIAAIAAPVLYVTGVKSPPRYRTIFDTMRSVNPRVAPLVAIDNASHNMQRDNPADFNAAVLDFLARH